MFTYRDKILDAVRVFLDLALAHTSNDVTREGLMRHVFGPATEKLIKGLDEKIVEILVPHQKGHPIIYNHYFTDVVPKARKRA